MRYQLEILHLVRGLGVTTLAALHDLNLAAEFCDRVHVLEAGRVVASGAPQSVLQPELLARVFGVGAQVMPHPRSGRPPGLLRARPRELTATLADAAARPFPGLSGGALTRTLWLG